MVKYKDDWIIAPVNPFVRLDREVWVMVYAEVSNWWLFDWMSHWSSLLFSNNQSNVYFKGRLHHVLVDNTQLHRNQLVIIQSSHTDNFFDLLRHLIIRLQLRVYRNTLSKLQCGLMHNNLNHEGIDIKSSRKVGFVYMVHVFDGDVDLDQIDIEEGLSKLDVFIHFKGTKNALIGYGEDRKKTIPFGFAGILVLAAFEVEQFDKLMKQNWYTEFMNMSDGNFIGLFKREM